jgi:4-amino-4-deoxy-L-arabinose transferase-like glycosyltransferase
LILLSAAAFRLVALPDLPPGLAQDEVLDADIALFIRGGEHAIFFGHGYGHEPLYHYLAAPFAPLLGDNWLAIRLPSVYLGLLLVALTMRWARRDYGPAAALVAGLGLAVSWWPVVFSRIGIRPILAPLLLVAAVWFWPLRRWAVTRRGLREAALAGLLLGLSIYSYTAARVAPLIPALLIVVLVAGFLFGSQGAKDREQTLSPTLSQRAREWRPPILYAAVVLAVSLLLYLPLGLTLRANPELQQRLEQLEGPLDALATGDAGPVARATLATLGVFSAGGDPRWTYSLPGRPLFDPLTAPLFYAGLALALWRWRRPVYAVLLVWLAVALLPSALSPDAPSTVRLVGALPVVYLLPGLAVSALGARLKAWGAVGERRAAYRALAGGVLAAAVLLLVANGWRTVRDAQRWSADLETRLRYQTALRDIARHWQAGDGRAPVVAEVFYEPIDGAGLRRSAGRDPRARWVQTGGGVAGALVWPAGPADARLYVPEYAPLDAELAEAAGLGAPVYRSDGQPSFAVYALPSAPAAELLPAEASFGTLPLIALRGFAPLNAAQAVGDGQLRLLSAWEVLAPLPADAAIFVHLRDTAGNVVAQHDGLDAAAETLQPGDRVWQRHVLALPALSEGEYRLVIGLYRRDDGTRLATADGGDAVLLLACSTEGEGMRCNLP